MSIHEFPSQEELARLNQKPSEPLDPMLMVANLKAKLLENPNPMCLDDKPIHWVIARAKEGLIIQDSGPVGSPFQFALQGLGALSDESLTDLTKVVLDWLANELPMTKEWDVCFVDHSPLEVGRKLVMPPDFTAGTKPKGV